MIYYEHGSVEVVNHFSDNAHAIVNLSDDVVLVFLENCKCTFDHLFGRNFPNVSYDASF